MSFCIPQTTSPQQKQQGYYVEALQRLNTREEKGIDKNGEITMENVLFKCDCCEEEYEDFEMTDVGEYHICDPCYWKGYWESFTGEIEGIDG